MEDKRAILHNESPFEYRLLKGDKAQILYRGRYIKMISGKEFARLEALIGQGDPYQIQLHLAKITRNFKRGNERMAKGSK